METLLITASGYYGPDALSLTHTVKTLIKIQRINGNQEKSLVVHPFMIHWFLREGILHPTQDLQQQYSEMLMYRLE